MIVGIDLGTSTSEVAYLKGGKPQLVTEVAGSRQGILPSVVGIGTSGALIVGENAEKQLAIKPQLTVAEVKRLMGTDQQVTLGGEDLTPPEVSALMLRHLKQEAERYFGEPVTEAVITVPAYFDALKRQATIDAAELAGLVVRRLINEPTAAALAYGVQRPGVEEKVLVYDLGGGTLDVTVLDLSEGVLDVLASTGNNELGGKEFDERLMQFLRAECLRRTGVDLTATDRQRNRLKLVAKRTKEELSAVEATDVVLDNIGSTAAGEFIDFELTVTREAFNAQIRDLIESTRAQLDEALQHKGLGPADIQTVLLVGGSTRIPLVREFVSRYFGGRALPTHVPPDEAVALGAAIMSGIVAGDPQVQTIITDVTSWSLGVAVIDDSGPVPIPDAFSVLIPKQTVIPRTTQRSYRTANDDQDSVRVRVYQGDAPRCADNRFVGEVDLPLAQRGPAGQELTIEFAYDLNNQLRVKVTEVATGQTAFGAMQPQRERMSEDAKAAARARLARKWPSSGSYGAAAAAPTGARPAAGNGAAPPDGAGEWRRGPFWERVAGLVRQAEKQREQLTGDARVRVVHLLEVLESAVRTGDGAAVSRAETALTDFLFDLG